MLIFFFFITFFSDGGNSHFPDTQRRVDELSAKGFLFVGCGVSGGEEGALNGPSLMPGGDPAAWPAIKPILQAIAAKVDDGSPCCDWVGKGGAGHFVKMVHNGIEYGDMQLLCEGYSVMRKLLGMSNAEMADTFDAWNNAELNSYLVEITRDILRHKDTETPDKDTVDLVVDRAGQKGTGKWTAVAALDAGMPLTLIGEAVFGRTLSAQKEERVAAAKLLGAAANPEVNPTPLPDRQKHIDALRGALYASKLVSYAQGFVLMREVSREHNWDLQFGSIALLWRGGCIVRSRFLGDIKRAFDADPELPNLLLAPFFREQVAKALPSWRSTASIAVLNGAWTPAITSALAYYDGYTSARLSHNLLQAQRDYFGAHTFERIDKPTGKFFHENWTGTGGTTTSSTYDV
jgi:6-phosphogluconate dehydrogenase